MNQHLLGKMCQLGVANLGNSRAITKIGALIWHIFPTQLNDSKLIGGSLAE